MCAVGVMETVSSAAIKRLIEYKAGLPCMRMQLRRGQCSSLAELGHLIYLMRGTAEDEPSLYGYNCWNRLGEEEQFGPIHRVNQA